MSTGEKTTDSILTLDVLLTTECICNMGYTSLLTFMLTAE